jgi:hypothetical protein
MRRSSVRVAIWAIVASWAWLGCGGTATVDGTGGGATSSTTGTGSTSSGGCAGTAPWCAAGCGSDYFPAQAECLGSEWVCPEGTVNPEDCPPGTCWGLPLPCEICGDSGWECAPTEACVGSCGGLACAACTGAPDAIVVGACQCACDENAQYTCQLAAGCCNVDFDCGDLAYVPCVNNVCKPTVAGGCWSDAECGDGESCVGATVCPCGARCDGPDAPGTCQ